MGSSHHNSLHRRQLFHWVGRHLENGSSRGRLTTDQRAAYVDCLRKTLKSGLWMKTPEEADVIGRHVFSSVTHPITCFTEWDLRASEAHTRKYGRLGFGFPRRFVLKHGGQPVQYIRDGDRGAPYATALARLIRWLDKVPDNGRGIEGLAHAREDLKFLSQFCKRVRRSTPKASRENNRKKGKSSTSTRERDPYARSYGAVLHYLEEREWRIVVPHRARYFRRNDEQQGPTFYLPFKPGIDLFTVVLPDNEAVNMALACPEIRADLYPEKAPHVTLLSLQDVGTF